MGAAVDAQFRAEVDDRVRAERAGVELGQRVVAARGERLTVTLTDGQMLSGELLDASMTWMLLGEGQHRMVVPMHAVASFAGLPGRLQSPTTVERRLTIGHVLRALARDRARVAVDSAGGTVTGVIGVVGADYVEVATGVGSVAIVALASVLVVRSAG